MGGVVVDFRALEGCYGVIGNADNTPGGAVYRPHTGIAMDMTNLMLSFLFGTCGMGFCMYGKKAGEFVPMGGGGAADDLPLFYLECDRDAGGLRGADGGAVCVAA